MVLAAAAGFGVEQLTSVERAVLPAILIGMVVALFVPAKGACPVNLSKAGAAAKTGPPPTS